MITLSLFSALGASAQSPASAFDRGSSLQSRQDPGLAELLTQCSNPPAPAPQFGGGGGAAQTAAPPDPVLPEVHDIDGVISSESRWRVVWAWEGNNADGPIAGENGTLIFANNDASNVMQLDPDTGLASILYEDTNTGGAVSRSKNGDLYLVMRGLEGGILQLEPERRVFADNINGEPFECFGGVINDLIADSLGGVYFSGVGGGLFYADTSGAIKEYGTGLSGTNGIMLNPDEDVLYVTNGSVVVAFDVGADGSLLNQRDFGTLSSGRGDGSAVDAEGRLYVANGSGADVFSPSGDLLGTIPGPQGMHGVAFAGEDKQTLFGIVFYGGWGTPSARNQIVAIPMISRGYSGRAK